MISRTHQIKAAIAIRADAMPALRSFFRTSSHVLCGSPTCVLFSSSVRPPIHRAAGIDNGAEEARVASSALALRNDTMSDPWCFDPSCAAHAIRGVIHGKCVVTELADVAPGDAVRPFVVVGAEQVADVDT